MFSAIFANLRFWVWFLGPLFFAVLLSRQVYKSWEWRYNTKNPNHKKEDQFSADAFRDPTNVTVAIASLVGPLIAALLGYLYVQQKATAEDLVVPIAGLLHLGLAVFIGLWNSFSLATLVDSDGKFKITGKLNTTVPATFTAQFIFLIIGLLWISGYSLLGFAPSSQSNLFPVSTASYAILKPALQIDMPKSEVDRLWGAPCRISTSGNTQTYIYEAATSVFTITIEGGKVVSIMQDISQSRSTCP